MFKSVVCAVVSLVFGLSACQVRAAVERETFEVFVTIPTADFYVLAVDPQWVQREQTMSFNPVSAQLAPLRAQFDVKNLGGAIGARLGEEAYLYNGTDRIDLQVTFNSVPLSLDPIEVVSTGDARPGKRVGLEIAAIKPADGYSPGYYFGTVHMVFDALAPSF